MRQQYYSLQILLIQMRVPLFLLLLALAQASASFHNQTGTYDCYYRCQSCSDVSPSSCTSCYSNYIALNNTCLPCGDNCISCVGESGRCQACASQFYLSQSTWTCNLCPGGASVCTFSAVQQCLPGYYLVNSICLYCISNCQTCSDASSCSVCNSGYYLTSQQTCSPCPGPYCSNCNQAGECLLCSNNRYGPNCQQQCDYFCQICDSSTCYQCQAGYYLSQLGSCEALSVVCESGTAPYVCSTCIQGLAYLDGSTCNPYVSVHLTNIQSYLKPLNQMELFNGSLTACQFGWMAQGSPTLSVEMTCSPSYKLGIKIQVMTVFGQESSVTVSSNSLQQSYTQTIVSRYLYECGNQSWVITNLQAIFTSNFTTPKAAQTFTLQISGSGSVGVSQVLLEEYLCLVQNCGICLSAYSCLSCLPPYVLENNKCLLVCSSGYYYTQKLMACSLTCPAEYYANLADYTCNPCVPPCKNCQSANKCLSCLQNYLLGDSCLQSCPLGYYADKSTNKCVVCQYPCSTCSSSPYNCTSCTIGFLDQSSGTCLISCKSGLYSNFSTITCSLCSSPCLTCEFTSDHCTSCLNPLFLNPNNTCLPSCDSTYAANPVTATCQKCAYPCQTCNRSASDCLACFAGFLESNSCVSTCKEGTYSDFQYKECLKCPDSCLSCLSKLQCTSCAANYYYSSNSQSCSSTCPNTSYPNADFTCTLCRPPCKTCLNSSYCLSCEGYLFVYIEGRCLVACPTATFVVLDTLTNLKFCQPCPPNCSICVSNTSCITCNGSSLFEGVCVESCPEGTYNYKSVCINCSFPCANCLRSDICLSCVSGYYYYNQSYSCLQICPNGFYTSGQSCLPCSPICKLCKDQTTNCITCARGYFKNSNGSCLTTCGYAEYAYTVQSICKKCVPPCLECLTGSLCTSCNLSSVYPYLFRHNCLASCPNLYYNQNYTCERCSDSCLYCSNTKHNCTQCRANYFFLPGSKNTCVDDCPDYYYANSAAHCTPCIPPCSLCASQYHCLSCLSKSSFLFNGDCLAACPFNYYSTALNGTNVCSRCDENCLQCFSNSWNCTQCGPALYLSSSSGVSNSYACVKSCREYYYKDVVNQVCMQCISPCLLCHSLSRCISCRPGFYLQFDTCVTTCLSGYYSSSELCLPCLAPCETCASQSKCLSCVTGYFYSSGEMGCLNQCPGTTYSFETSNGDLQCLSCPNSCLQCYDSISCRSCRPDSLLPYLQGTTCQTSCTSGYYSVEGSTVCQWCGWGCLLCDTSGTCIQCSNSYLYEGACQIQCPIGYYENPSFICQKCIAPCEDCYNAANCQFCIAGYFLYSTHCLQTCPANQWTILPLGICNETCDSTFFKIAANKTCVGSCQAYYDADSSCVDRCPLASMANSSLGCESCSTADCTKYLTFQLIPYQRNGQLFLVMAFNIPIDITNFFTQDSITLLLTPSPPISQSQLQLSALRSLFEEGPIASVSVADTQPYFISLQVDLKPYGEVFSGVLSVNVENLNAITVSGYPLQSRSASSSLVEYQVNDGGVMGEYLGWVVAVSLIIVFAINFALGNQRSVLIAVDGIQTVHALYYVAVWNHPLVQNYMLALKLTAFRSSLFTVDQTLQNCPPKYIMLYGSCNFYLEIVLPLLVIMALLVVVVICKFASFLQGRHHILWNHAHSIWWLAGMSLGISGFYCIGANEGLKLGMGILVGILFIVCGLVLGFKIVENVYSNSFSQKCFFWQLKKRKAAHQLSNLHCLLLLVRRIVMVVAVSVGYNSPLSSLFIVTLLTICILSNIIINHPFRNYGVAIGISEALLSVILVLLQMYIVNASRITNSTWHGFGYTIFFFIIAYNSILLGIAIKETSKYLRKVIVKMKSKVKDGSNMVDDKPKEQEKESQEQKASADLTQQQLIKSNSFSPKNADRSHLFSQNSHLESRIAPKLLLKIQKQSAGLIE